jgi:hypothetical protein
MKRLVLVAAASALSLFGAAAHANTTIDTTPFWDGSSSIQPFGSPDTAVYGETFVAPGGNLLDYTFYVSTPTDLNVVGEVYAWSGNLLGGNYPQGAVGPALFTSAAFTIVGGDSGFQAVTVNTGGLALATGQQYVALLHDTDNANLFSTGVWGDLLYSHPGVAGDGGFNFYNINTNNQGALNGGVWDDFADFGSSAWTAHFAGGVPEPAEWALMVLGFGAAGASLRARKRAAAATA